MADSSTDRALFDCARALGVAKRGLIEIDDA